jgi:hypothetical protein
MFKPHRMGSQAGKAKMPKKINVFLFRRCANAVEYIPILRFVDNLIECCERLVRNRNVMLTSHGAGHICVQIHFFLNIL